MWSRGFAVVVLAASVPLAGLAAERKAVRLDYQLSAEGAACASEQEIRALVSARLGFDPFLPDAPQTARMSITSRDSKLFGSVQLFDADGAAAGSREVDAAPSDCGALAETLALALAIAIDPHVLTRAPLVRPPDPPPPHPAPPPAPLRAQFVSLEEEEEGPSSIWSADVGPSVAVGLLPQVAVGFSIEGRWRLSGFSLAAEGSLFPMNLLETMGGTVETSIIRGGLRTCGHYQMLGFCLRGTAGVLNAGGRGYVNDRRDALPAATVGPLAFLEGRPAKNLMARVGVGLDVALIRSSIFVGTTEVWRPSPMSVEARASLGWVSP